MLIIMVALGVVLGLFIFFNMGSIIFLTAQALRYLAIGAALLIFYAALENPEESMEVLEGLGAIIFSCLVFVIPMSYAFIPTEKISKHYANKKYGIKESNEKESYIKSLTKRIDLALYAILPLCLFVIFIPVLFL